MDGDERQDMMVNLIDYIVDPRIHLKNYMVMMDSQKALANLQANEDLF